MVDFTLVYTSTNTSFTYLINPWFTFITIK